MNAIKIDEFLRSLHENQRGDIPVGQILVIGLIVIPLVLTLVLFRGEVKKFLEGQWSKLTGADKGGQFSGGGSP